MKSVKLRRHTDRTEITLTGVLDVGVTRAAHDALGEALARALPMELLAAGLERIDTAGLQLLLVFLRTARERGLTARWREASDALTSNAQLLGLAVALELPQ
jgi:ABC-type transporter Mla MlaB component